MTLPETRCPTLLLTSCYLDREGGWGGDDNVPFDRKMTLPKTRCPTLLLTSCYLDREGGFGGGMITFLSTVRWRLNKKLMIYVRSWQFRFAHQHQYIQTLGKLFKTKNADWKSTEEKRMHWTSSRCCGIAKVFFGTLTSCSKRQNIIDHNRKIL